jgi:hypothetical protein
MLKRASRVSAGAGLPLRVAAVIRAVQEVAPLVAVQLFKRFARVLIFAEGMVNPVGTDGPGETPVAILAN